MSILYKHPVPWTCVDDGAGDVLHFLDAGGAAVIESSGDDGGSWICVDDDVKRLILAAPELLAALKMACEYYHGSDGDIDLREKHKALIARIEGGNV